MPDLAYSGRTANHSLNFRQWNKSKLAQYFTPLRLSEAIFRGLTSFMDQKDISNLNVLDPTAGNGRLLWPWKQEGARVFGIEVDRKAANACKQNINAANTYVGDLLSYIPFLKNTYFDVVLMNPPFGLTWDISEVDFPFQTSHYGGTIDSLAATIEIATASMGRYGWTALILPTSTFSNEKDKRIVSFLHENFSWFAHYTLPGVFKEEYGIDVSVDLLIGQKDDTLRTPEKMIIENIKELPLRLTELLTQSAASCFPWNMTIDLPQINLLKSYLGELNTIITARGVKGDALTQNLLGFFNETMSEFSPIIGKPCGIVDAWLSGSALAVHGVEKAQNFIQSVGFALELNENQRHQIHRLQKRYRFDSIPMFGPKSHQLLAYFDDNEYKAVDTVTDAENQLLFIEGNSYHLRPKWIRHSEVVKSEQKKDSHGKTFQQLTAVDKGYLSIEIETELGVINFNEPDKVAIERLLRAFPLPVVNDLGELYPDRINHYKRLLDKKIPNLFDYQKEDVARLCLKNFGYLGYEMGGGKTISALAYAVVRDFKRVLVICQSSLIDNWINEGAKFGIEIKRLTTHLSIDKLKTKPDKQEIYITSYEFLSLDTARQYDSWECKRYDRDGNQNHHEITGNRRCSKGHDYTDSVKSCPQCGETKVWSGNYCRACGYVAYTYSGMKQYPAYKRIKKAFSCIIVDEAQMAKNKSGRGEAVRALKAKAKLLLSGTIMKGYVIDVYHNFRWLLGSGTPLFPYPYKAGSKLFLDEFGTYEMVSKEFEETLTSGRRKLIPEVSNLNRFWRLIASFTIRRTKNEMVPLPPKKRQIQLLPMDSEHNSVYQVYQKYAEHLIERELRKNEQEVNMGVISAALWKLRFAASAPNDKNHLASDNNQSGPTEFLDRQHYNKTQAVIHIIKEIMTRKEKVIIFSGLRSMQNNIVRELRRHGIEFLHVPSETPTNKRFAAVETFTSNGHTALITGLNVMNRGFTITCASNVIITDLEYTPEAHQQAEDRAHRTGQTKPVNVYYLLSKGTIDEHIYEIIAQKARAIDHAINGKAVYASTAELLEQMDQRNVQLAIARHLIEKRDQSDIITTEPAEVIEFEAPITDAIPEKTESVLYHVGASVDDEQFIHATIIRRRATPHKKISPGQLDLFAA